MYNSARGFVWQSEDIFKTLAEAIYMHLLFGGTEIGIQAIFPYQ